MQDCHKLYKPRSQSCRPRAEVSARVEERELDSAWQLAAYCKMLRHGRRLLSDGLSRASIENVGNAQLTERLVSGALATSSGTSAFLQAYTGSKPRALHSLAKAFSSFAKRSGSAPAQLYTQLQKVNSLAEVYSETAECDNTSHFWTSG